MFNASARAAQLDVLRARCSAKHASYEHAPIDLDATFELDPPLPVLEYETVDEVGRFSPVPVPFGWDAIESDAVARRAAELLADDDNSVFLASPLPSDAIIDVTTGALMSQACRLKVRLVSEWIESLPD